MADQFAPNRTVKMFGISHNMQTDVMDMALLGMHINLASLRKLGGKFRDSLESSVLTFRDDEIISELRGRSNVIVGQSLDIIIEDLRAKSIKRKEEWLE